MIDAYNMHKNARIVLDAEFITAKKIISYGLIVYALNSSKTIIVQRKHSIEFLLILSGEYRPSLLFYFLKYITKDELNIMHSLCNNDKKYFKKVFIDVGLQKKNYKYAYLRFTDCKNIILNYNHNLNSNLEWTWPKGRINIED